MNFMEQERFLFLRILLQELIFAGLDVAIHFFQETKPVEACGVVVCRSDQNFEHNKCAIR